MENKIVLLHSTIILTLRCTLNCRLCSAFVPSYKTPPHYSFEIVTKTCQKLFDTVDYIDKFTLTGGEPFLHEDLHRIIDYVYDYSKHFNRLQIITNGTLLPKPAVVDALRRHKDNIYIIIDHYGKLSTQVDALQSLLTENNIKFEVRKYYGPDSYYGGWVDYGDYTRHNTKEKVLELSQKCASIQMGYTWGIWDGVMHPCCSTSHLAEILPEYARKKVDFVDLFDDNLSRNEKRAQIARILSTPYLEACYYCDGMCPDSIRHPAAEQV